MNICIKILNENAQLPTRATLGSAGYDIFACTDKPILIKKGEIVKIPTGIAVSLNTNSACVLIYARSGLASKYGITLANSVGVIDSDYRGEIIIPLINLGTEDYTVQPEQRIAQMVVTPVFLPNFIVSDTLSETERGENGFGSTGE